MCGLPSRRLLPNAEGVRQNKEFEEFEELDEQLLLIRYRFFGACQIKPY
jgi:hypothetical protein